MSKDLEKKNEQLERSNEKLEKQNRKLKKKNKTGGKIILFLLLIILIFAAVVFFLDPFGWGFNYNSLTGGNSNSSGSAQTQAVTEPTSAATEDAPAETEPHVTVISVTVSGSTYLLDSAEASVDKIVKYASELNSDVIVEVKDDSATKNAMDALTAALEAAKISYTVK